MLLKHFEDLMVGSWKKVFPQRRTLRRAVEHALAQPCCFGRRTLSRTICALDRHQRDWSADYKIYSRSRRNEEELFTPVLETFLQRYPQRSFFGVALDDTKVAKTGKKVPHTFWQRDPMSPPFRMNLLYGLRFVQASLLFPHYEEGPFPARAFPVRFTDAPAVKKPGKRASKETRAHYRQAVKTRNLSAQGLDVMKSVRDHMDRFEAHDRIMLVSVDGSFCNQTVFRAALDRIDVIARCRKDAALCFPAAPGTRRIYAPHVFRPEEVRKNSHIPWKRAFIHYGGKKRSIRYKKLDGVLWRRGAGSKPLRLLVIAPQPYRVSPRARRNYRQPAYLLSTNTTFPARILLQVYFDRWQVEVNFRDEKDVFGVGQAQVRASKSVARQPAFSVATYSLLLLAGLKHFGPGRSHRLLTLPKWRKHSQRPSILDYISLLRKEVHETRGSTCSYIKKPENMTLYAYT